MAQTPERKVKGAVVSILKAHGAYYFFPATHGYGRSGVPDIVACVNGRFMAIECKAGYNLPTELQLREMEAIERAGGMAFVVREDSVGLVECWIKLLQTK